MNLNHIRILESCHKFLIGITSFEEEFQDDTLVYQYRNQNITFDTYQESNSITFSDYNLEYSRLNEEKSYIDKRQDIIQLFPSEEHLRALSRIPKAEQARIQIFKLLSQINLEILSSKYPDLKKDNFGYGFYNFATKEEYPIYLFSEDDHFELVAIN